MRTLKLASHVARKYHSGQMYGPGSYYDNHLEPVRAHLEEMGAGEMLQAAGLLHDILEDTFFPEASLLELFPATVSRTVQLLTHRDGVSYDEYMAGILEDKNARLVKFADSTANFAACISEEKAEILETGYRSDRTARRLGKYRRNLDMLKVF